MQGCLGRGLNDPLEVCVVIQAAGLEFDQLQRERMLHSKCQRFLAVLCHHVGVVRGPNTVLRAGIVDVLGAVRIDWTIPDAYWVA
jgi:hypothetical protein